MLKHIREALRQAGLKPGSVTAEKTKAGHVCIHIGELRVWASATPSCPHAAKHILKDIKHALSAQHP